VCSLIKELAAPRGGGNDPRSIKKGSYFDKVLKNVIDTVILRPKGELSLTTPEDAVRGPLPIYVEYTWCPT
jgi:hypothetical protein